MRSAGQAHLLQLLPAWDTVRNPLPPIGILGSLEEIDTAGAAHTAQSIRHTMCSTICAAVHGSIGVKSTTVDHSLQFGCKGRAFMLS